MLESAEVLAARRKSFILNERKKIDFLQEFENVKKQIATGIYKHHKVSTVEFKIMTKNSKVPINSSIVPIFTSWMCRENRRELFNLVQDWLESKNYDYFEVYNRRKNFSGFIVSWEDYLEVDPLEFKEEEPEIEIDSLTES